MTESEREVSESVAADYSAADVRMENTVDESAARNDVGVVEVIAEPSQVEDVASREAGAENVGAQDVGAEDIAAGDDVGTADVGPGNVGAEEVEAEGVIAGDGGAEGEHAHPAADDAGSDDVATDGMGPDDADAAALDVTVPDDLFGPIEAIMMVVDEPLPALTLAQVLGRPVPEVEEALQKLSESYTAEGRGFDLRQVGGGWRFYTREQYAEVVERFVLDGQQAKLTQAALETLAVVAYQQPVSRARVSAIRGVNCDGVVRTLLTRGLIEEAGTDQESGATLYRTTSYFLERLGLRSLDELPSLAPYLPEVDEVDQEQAVPTPVAVDAGAPGAGAPDVGSAEDRVSLDAGAIGPGADAVADVDGGMEAATDDVADVGVNAAANADSHTAPGSLERPDA